MCCNRDKDSITLNLKDPEAMSVLHRLVEKADVVQHNMRYDAAERLGVDYESLRQLNSRLIYCHTLGHEQGPRQAHPGNDQTGAALAGTDWLDGGLDHGGRPIWPNTSLGDTGNGFLSALGIIQALYDRDRTGEGQFLRTFDPVRPSPRHFDGLDYRRRVRGRRQAEARRRAVRVERPLPALSNPGRLALRGRARSAGIREALGCPGPSRTRRDPRFATSEARLAHDADLIAELTPIFSARPATAWFQILDGHQVPCEVSDPDYVVRLFSDPEADQLNLVASFRHHVMGDMKMAGLYFDLSDTPGKIWGPPAWPGLNTRQILAEVGYTPDEIEKLLATRAAEATDALGA